MSTYDRKSELQRKKDKLATLRLLKFEREKLKSDTNLNGSQESVSGPQNSGDIRLDADELLKSIGLSSIDVPSSGVVDGLHMSKSSSALLNHVRNDSPRRRTKLEITKPTLLMIPPRDSISYSKQTQTAELVTPAHFANVLHTDSPRDMLTSPKSMNYLEWDDEFSTILPFEASFNDGLDITGFINEVRRMPVTTPVQPAKTPEDVEHERAQAAKAVDLTDEQRDSIMRSDKFCIFFDRAARILERAVDDPCNIFIDYTGADRDDQNGVEKHQLLRFNRDFFDERWSRKRMVTAMDWSPIFPELLLAAYHTNEDAPHDPDGVCLLWNLRFQKTSPEHIFHCQSAVTSATLVAFHPNLVIGGTYSGQIVLWDNRYPKRTPVQRTPLSAMAHTHPISAVMLAGSQNAHSLLSVSSDGRMCSWSLDMLGQPQQTMELAYRQTKTVAATSVAFFNNDVNNFVVGAEDGLAYIGSRHGNHPGITKALEGHQAPITSIAMHAATDGPIDFSTLFLTTSLDWTVKLWSAKENAMVYSFDDATDYVFDVDWSPVNPAIFATADCTGRLEIWNLNQDTEVSAARTSINRAGGLNKCRFHSSGQHIAVGDDNGRIHMFDLNEAMVSPKADEWNTFTHTINELRQMTAEHKEREFDHIPTQSSLTAFS